MTRHLRSLLDMDSGEFRRALALSREVKRNRDAYRTKLSGKSIGMMFAKPSTRTRVSFEVGAYELGAHPMFLTIGGATGLQMNRGESHHDTAKVLSRYCHALVVRTFAQAHIDALAEHASIPIINALTDSYHPCQSFADALTMQEHLGEDLRGTNLVFVGPGNNVTHSLMLAGPRAGFDVVCACPDGLPPDAKILQRAQDDAAKAGTQVLVTTDTKEACTGAHAIYTDAWVSMGQESQAATLKAKLKDYVVDEELMAIADPKAIFMHCLPAHRGEEVTDGVIDGPQSAVFDEAENRLHTQKALLLLLMEAEPWS